MIFSHYIRKKNAVYFERSLNWIQAGIEPVILSRPLCHLSYRASLNFLVIHILLVLQMFQHHATEEGLQSSESGSGGQRER